jgi:hypothetical protein
MADDQTADHGSATVSGGVHDTAGDVLSRSPARAGALEQERLPAIDRERIDLDQGLA